MKWQEENIDVGTPLELCEITLEGKVEEVEEDQNTLYSLYKLFYKWCISMNLFKITLALSST